MKLKAVLDRLPGLTKSEVDYWCLGEHITPNIVARGKRHFRDYAPAWPKMELMYVLTRQGWAVEEASRWTDEVLQEGAAPLDLLKEQSLDVLRSGPLSLKEKLSEEKRARDSISMSQGLRLAYPGKQAVPKTSLGSSLRGLDLGLTPHQLGLLAESCLSVLHRNVNALVAMSPDLAIVAGAVSVLALEHSNRAVVPFAVTYARGKPEMVGGTAPGELSVALLTRSTADLDSTKELRHLLRYRKHNVRQVVAVVHAGNVDGLRELSAEGIDLAYLFAEQDIAEVWSRVPG